MSHVEIKGLAKSFGGTSVFRDIDLTIERGQICVLLGPSGCGKTTLLRAVAGLATPDSGTIRIAGKDVSRMAPKDRGVGMVFQHYALFPNMTVEGNLAFGLEQQRLSASLIKSRVDAMISLMELGPRAKARPAQLSGGQRQRVALARALVLEPGLLLLDEPMSALDAQIRKRLREDLRSLQRKLNFTAMFVTHDQEEAMVIGDKIAIMHQGRFAQVGAPFDVHNNPRSRIVASFLGDLNVLEPAAIQRIFGVASQQAWAIHPGSLTVSDRGPSEERLSLTATITDSRVLGPVIRYSLEASGHRLTMDQLNLPGQTPFGCGLHVKIALAKTAIRPLAD